MHISEGVLTPQVLAAGGAVAAVGLAVGLKRMSAERVPEVAVLSSAFFVGSLVHVPVGPVSAHLVLSGITGLLLGWAAFPSIFVGLVLQAVLFQYGGLTTLGVNTLIMALPALVGYYLFGGLARSGSAKKVWLGGFCAGAFAIAGGAVIMALSLGASGEGFVEPAKLAVYSNIPVMVAEGVITGFCVSFLKKVKPEMLEARR